MGGGRGPGGQQSRREGGDRVKASLPWVRCCPFRQALRFRTVLQGVEPTVTLLRLLNEIGAIQTRPADPLRPGSAPAGIMVIILSPRVSRKIIYSISSLCRKWSWQWHYVEPQPLTW